VKRLGEREIHGEHVAFDHLTDFYIIGFSALAFNHTKGDAMNEPTERLTPSHSIKQFVHDRSRSFIQVRYAYVFGDILLVRVKLIRREH
jgi:hypothetical protein